jgi:hypothetical protein
VRGLVEVMSNAKSNMASPTKGKIVHSNSLIGQQGINLIASTVSTMGFLWTPTTGHSDAGIDGYIEIRRTDIPARKTLRALHIIGTRLSSQNFGGSAAVGFWKSRPLTTSLPMARCRRSFVKVICLESSALKKMWR